MGRWVRCGVEEARQEHQEAWSKAVEKRCRMDFRDGFREEKGGAVTRIGEVFENLWVGAFKTEALNDSLFSFIRTQSVRPSINNKNISYFIM